MSFKKQKTENSFIVISSTEYFIDRIKYEISCINNENKPFVHGRTSPFIDVAKQNGRESPFDDNGLFIKNIEKKDKKEILFNEI